ncbi:MAG: hypothetical protein HC839_04625, partial [Leptolyngbyaceae cyanobacterium RM2_2_21]|nr:hypothetical protein [Leptolyngbyaceae cyanobacterium RM2_2_21]
MPKFRQYLAKVNPESFLQPIKKLWGSVFIWTALLIIGPAALVAQAQATEESPAYTFDDVFYAFIILSFLILVGRWIRQRISLLQALFLPSSIVAGAIALLLGPGALGALVSAVAGDSAWLANGLFPQPILEVWSAVPGVFINIVFATIFLGEFIPPP